MSTLWTTGRGLYVLLALLIIRIFISPITIADGLSSDIILECVFALILIAGVSTTPCSKGLRLSMLLIVFLAIFARILDRFDHSNFIIANADDILAAITLVIFSTLIIKHFLINKALLRHRITAAVAVYLIFGVLWARIYDIMYSFNSAAFSLNGVANSFSFIYFSFVTLMTLGYGDIVPVSMAARSLAILEGLVGQLYMVILISSLVSEFSALALKSSNEQN